MSQGAKPGYGPKEPKGFVDPYDGTRDENGKAKIKQPKPLAPGEVGDRGRAAGADPYGDAKRIKGMAVNPAIVRQHVDDALAASRALNAAKKRGESTHLETQAVNEALARLQQSDSLAHASVLAIHTLESQIAEGKETKMTREHLKQANANLRARLKQGARAIRP